MENNMAGPELNRAQKEAVSCTEGPLLIISCPGSGKTTTLLWRAGEIIKRGADPRRVLTVTFTNAAAESMRRRYRALFGGDGGMPVMTIHSLCFGILRAQGLYQPSDILREEEKRRFFYQRLSSLSYISDPWDMTVQIMSEVSALRSSGTDPARFTPSSCDSRLFFRLLRAYDDYRDENHRLDFDDMLVQCRQLLMEEPEVLSRWQARFSHIQCDEYQDTSAVQRDILYLLAERHRNLCLVGDDDQSIYMFRGASPSIMLHFEKDFPDCRSVRLSVNYRSGREIVDRAGLLIARNSLRYQKDFLSARGAEGFAGRVLIRSFDKRPEELTYLAASIRKAGQAGVPYGRMAVLIRTVRQASGPAAALKREGIPVWSTEKVRSLYGSWIFRGIRSYALLALGRGRSEDLLYVLNRPGRYLKEEAFRTCPFALPALLEAASYLKREAVWKYEAARDRLTLWTDLLGPGSLTDGDSPSMLFQALKSLDYEGYLKAYAAWRNLDFEEVLFDYRAMEKEAAAFGSLGEWLAYAGESASRERNTSLYRDQDGVVLTTMHKAKGLEWDHVYVIDVNEGLVPHKNAGTEDQIQEERRLLYVAMTRARDALFLLSSGQPSSFVLDLLSDQRSLEADRFRAALEEAGEKGPLHVRHIRYGRGETAGTFARNGRLRLKVAFADKVRSFPFPDAFTEGFLAWEEEEREPF